MSRRLHRAGEMPLAAHPAVVAVLIAVGLVTYERATVHRPDHRRWVVVNP